MGMPSGPGGRTLFPLTTNGDIYLWDNNYRNSDVSIASSPTFTQGSARLNNALRQAVEAVENAKLHPNIRAIALQNIDNKNFVTNTAGDGGAKNSVKVNFCNGRPC